MINSKTYFITIFFILYILVPNTIEEYICESVYRCDTCNYCGTSTNNYTSCFYYNIFCKNEYYKLTYSPFMKSTLINIFQNDSSITSFCGQKEYIIDNTTDEVVIFNSQDKNFIKDKYIHCHYYINTESVVEYSPYFYFSLSKNMNSTEPRNLKFELSNIYKKSDDSEEIELLSHSQLRPKNNFKINIETEKTVEIFLDFLESNYTQPEEILEIKFIIFDKKSSSSSSSSNAATIGGAIGGILCLIIIGGVAYYCCCGKSESNETNERFAIVKLP